MRDSFTSMHVFNVSNEKLIAALMSYLDVAYLSQQIQMLQQGRALTQEEDRKMFHYIFRKKGKHDVFLEESHASIYMDIGPCPDIEIYAQDISRLVNGSVLFYSTFENDPVECGLCHNGETVTMLVRGNGRDRELVHKKMSMDAFYSTIGKDVQKKTNYNRIDVETLPDTVERDCAISLRGEELEKHRENGSITQIYDTENLVIYDLSIRNEEDRQASIEINKIPVGNSEEGFFEILLSAIAVGFLSLRENRSDLPKIPLRGTVLLQDLMNLYAGEKPSSRIAREVLLVLLQNGTDSWSDTWIREKKEQLLRESENL